MPSNILHSKATPRWGTPEELVGLARLVMGGLDLDPCSEEKFNKVIQAPTYYSLLERDEDGLALPWFGRVFCNPPGGLVKRFWQKALAENIEQMFWVGFSVEQLCILADEPAHPLDFSCCILRRRVGFTRHDDFEGSPAHGNYVCGVGVDPARFEATFSRFGKVIHGKLSGAGSHNQFQGL